MPTKLSYTTFYLDSILKLYILLLHAKSCRLISLHRSYRIGILYCNNVLVLLLFSTLSSPTEIRTHQSVSKGLGNAVTRFHFI